MPDFDDIVEELSQHLRDRYDELRAGGLTEDAARRELSREFEGEASLRQAMLRALPPRAERAALGAPRESIVGGLWQDVRCALRAFTTTPGFTAVVVLTLALGIGATAAIFSVVDAVMLRPFPYADLDRIVALNEITRKGQNMSIAWPNFEDWRDQNEVFEHLGLFRGATANLTGTDRP
ncbi:MAG TPA: permease prefix domain 1-containing protein, partial [Vicinamibacterales bacterium]|nr:permease prefix domain 1-containing protein [Vicinamibacterales bacterium]